MDIPSNSSFFDSGRLRTKNESCGGRGEFGKTRDREVFMVERRIIQQNLRCLTVGELFFVAVVV